MAYSVEDLGKNIDGINQRIKTASELIDKLGKVDQVINNSFELLNQTSFQLSTQIEKDQDTKAKISEILLETKAILSSTMSQIESGLSKNKESIDSVLNQSFVTQKLEFEKAFKLMNEKLDFISDTFDGINTRYNYSHEMTTKKLNEINMNLSALNTTIEKTQLSLTIQDNHVITLTKRINRFAFLGFSLLTGILLLVTIIVSR